MYKYITMKTIDDISKGILLACVLIIIYTLMKKILSENYQTKKEKATEISNWWNKNNDNPSYAKYKNDLQRSDVVEYNNVRTLGGDITPERVERVIG